MWSAPYHSLWPKPSQWWPSGDDGCFRIELHCKKQVLLWNHQGAQADRHSLESSSFMLLPFMMLIPWSPFPLLLSISLFGFFLNFLFSTFVNENHLSKQGQNLSHTLLNPLIGGKKMNYFTFIFTSGKKYGIQVFCAKFWREMIFSHPSNRWLGKWSGLKCKCGDINYCCYWDIYKNSVALF